jgi:hypothetical protein
MTVPQKPRESDETVIVILVFYLYAILIPIVILIVSVTIAITIKITVTIKFAAEQCKSRAEQESREGAEESGVQKRSRSRS